MLLDDNSVSSQTSTISHIILNIINAPHHQPIIHTTTTSIHLFLPTSTPLSSLPIRTTTSNDPLVGITYSPYNNDGTCRSKTQVYSDFQRLLPLNIDLVRIYGVDCDQVSTVTPAAYSIGVKLFLGIFDLNSLIPQIQTLVSAIQGTSPIGWQIVDTISVGNELVNNGQATATQVIEAIRAARGMLRAAGYQGSVVTVDTFFAVENEPGLCVESDYCAVNVHAFFDSQSVAEMAGEFVLRKVADVKEVLEDEGKRVVVTESGWPWQGMANGAAVPGRIEQKIAIESIKQAWRDNPWGGLYLFTAFDDSWKVAEPGTFYAEQFWGME
ncbi:cell surface manno protein MP65 [Podospora fimiseda]|uniref:Cell surface manno protein MP65 n=1 Tax=Podospora fimiseda TaxID=252190 RepID=A0AAN7BYF7_9PEZI|nr:cell surface manno protein MP65 [Podospora fimiseda]